MRPFVPPPPAPADPCVAAFKKIAVMLQKYPDEWFLIEEGDLPPICSLTIGALEEATGRDTFDPFGGFHVEGSPLRAQFWTGCPLTEDEKGAI